jgi:hypothetical protein
MSITSRWNSAVVRVTPSSMFFLIVNRSMGLQGTHACGIHGLYKHFSTASLKILLPAILYTFYHTLQKLLFYY